VYSFNKDQRHPEWPSHLPWKPANGLKKEETIYLLFYMFSRMSEDQFDDLRESIVERNIGINNDAKDGIEKIKESFVLRKIVDLLSPKKFYVNKKTGDLVSRLNQVQRKDVEVIRGKYFLVIVA
jgi:hypothetical protein